MRYPEARECSPAQLIGVALPDRGEFANDVNEQLVVELYSK